MPVEIKDLHIKITVHEAFDRPKNDRLSNAEIKKLKADIIHECKRKILEELKQKQRR